VILWSTPLSEPSVSTKKAIQKQKKNHKQAPAQKAEVALFQVLL
jgi:hypothetical protein